MMKMWENLFGLITPAKVTAFFFVVIVGGMLHLMFASCQSSRLHYLVQSYYVPEYLPKMFHVELNDFQEIDIYSDYSGIWYSWHSDGSLKSRGRYINGKLNGIFESWRDNGDRSVLEKIDGDAYLYIYWSDTNSDYLEQLNNYSIASDGSIIEHGMQIEWYENGQIKEAKGYHQGELDGKYQEWYKDGSTESRANYKNGLEHGLSQYWYADGTREQVEYKNGAVNGLAVYWYNNGQMDQRINQRDDKWHGLYEKWHKNGQLSVRGNFKHDEKDGLFEGWDEDGKLVLQQHFVKGKFISSKTFE